VAEPLQAVKAGGPDPEANRALSVVIREAKASGVPNDNIQRAIARGSSANEADFKEAVYEVGLLECFYALIHDLSE
jgi:transcriptional/translational regulatory protein YebC/TACO1